MSLRTVLENLESVDPIFHEHYTEKDGKFYLDIEDDIRAHPKGAALKAIIDRMKSEKQTVLDKLTETEAKLADLPDDFDAEKYAAEMDELAALRKKGGGGGNDDDDDEARAQVKRLYEQRITNLENKHSTDKQKLLDEKKSLETQIERLMGDEGLTKALVAAGVDKKLLPGATALLRKAIKVRRNEDGEWAALVESDVGESTIDEYVSNWAQSDEGEIYIAKAKGGDAHGNNGNGRLINNPFAVGEGKKPNLTLQQELIAKNPDRARSLAQAAGVTPNW